MSLLSKHSDREACTGPFAQKRMKVAFATTYDASNIRNWSGTPYHLIQALKRQNFDLSFIGPLPRPRSLWPVLKAKGFFYNHLLEQRYHPEHDCVVARHYSRLVDQQLTRNGKTDLVFSPGSIPVAFLETDCPIVIWSDATHAGLFDFYPEYSNLCPAMVRDGHRIEQAIIDRARAIILTSDWAAQSAIQDYGADPAKVHVVPYGANLEQSLSPEAVTKAIRARPRRTCKLLFIGIDWERKGGEMVLAAARKLNEIGLPTEVTVVGCNPFQNRTQPDFVRCEGFLSKTVARDRQRIEQLLTESHFLMVPSLAECFGIVFCEANAFGVPCLARSVGGVPTIIQNGRNGFLFPPTASPDAYAQKIEELFQDYNRYIDLADSSINEFRTRLNWDVTGSQVRRIIDDTV